MPDHDCHRPPWTTIPGPVLGRLALLTLLGLATLPAPGCNRQGGTTGDRAEPAAPQRIVSITPALTEILFSLGLGNRVVGVTSFCDYPPEARQKTKVGGYINPSVEAILALNPDLVLVSPNTGNREAALAVQRAGAPLVVVRAETLSDTYKAIETVARACGVEEKGSELVRTLQQKVEAAAERVRLLPPVRVLFCVQLDPIIAAGPGTLPAQLLELAGGSNVVEAQGYPRLGVETVIERAPEMILQSRMDTPEKNADRKALEFWRRWPSIPAVRSGKVKVFDGTTALRPGPRVATAVEELSRLLHPEIPPATSGGGPPGENGGGVRGSS